MTVHTGDLDSLDIAPVQLAATMAILFEVAIDAVHAFFEMDVLQVYRDTGALFRAISRFTDTSL
jgi:hypothetical protein